MKTLLVVTTLLISFFLLLFRPPPKVEVDDILKAPDFYNGRKVEVTGVVMEVDESEKEKTCYVKGDSGRNLRIILRNKSVNVYGEYSIRGIVYGGPVSGHVHLVLVSCREKKKRENIYVVYPRTLNSLFTYCIE